MSLRLIIMAERNSKLVKLRQWRLLIPDKNRYSEKIIKPMSPLAQEVDHCK